MKLIFYASVKNLEAFKNHGFYKEDISILKNSGFDLIITNKIYDFIRYDYDASFLYFYKKSLFPSIISNIRLKPVFYTGGIDELSQKLPISFFSRFLHYLFFLLNLILSKKINIVSKSDFDNVNHLLKYFHLESLKSKIVFFPHSFTVFEDYSIDFINKNNDFATVVWMANEANVKRKGVDISLYYFYDYVKNNPDSRFYIIGEKGSGFNYLYRIVSELNLRDKVIFTGRLSEIEKINVIIKCKFYFQLSQYEGFGLAVLEAILLNCFIIHSNSGGILNSGDFVGMIINEHSQNFFKNMQNLDYDYINSKIKENRNFIISKYSNNKRGENLKSMICNDK